MNNINALRTRIHVQAKNAAVCVLLSKTMMRFLAGVYECTKLYEEHFLYSLSLFLSNSFLFFSALCHARFLVVLASFLSRFFIALRTTRETSSQPFAHARSRSSTAAGANLPPLMS
jgi:hypothetical protein